MILKITGKDEASYKDFYQLPAIPKVVTFISHRDSIWQDTLNIKHFDEQVCIFGEKDPVLKI